jgi:hypothetical protein
MTTARPKPPPPGANRRVHPRFEIRLAAEMVLSGGRRATAVTRDLSEGGSCVESAYALPEGETIDVALFVVVDGVEEASLPPLRIKATVQWTAQNDEGPIDARHIGGLRFEDLSAAQAAWIARFLKPGT